MSSPYYNACNPTLMALDDPCGCAVTKCSLYMLDCEALKSRDWYEEGIARTYAQVREGRLCGVPEDSMTTLLMSRLKPGKSLQSVTGIGVDGWSGVAPFFEIPYKGVINANYWVIESGHAGAGKQWHVVVKNSSSTYATDLPSLERYFLADYYVAIHYVDANKIGRNVTMKIISATNADAGGVNKAHVILEPLYSTAGWNALDPSVQAYYQPEHGLLELLASSISDYSSSCSNKPANISWKWRDFWWQTIRSTFCITDAYLDAMNAPLLGDFQKRFRMLPVAEIRKQHAMLEERQFWNTVFWGKKISDYQTKADYRSLTAIADPADLDCYLEYLTNTEGIFSQLDACSKNIDLEGGELDFDAVLVKSEYLVRYRGEKTGESVNRIEWMTDTTTANAIRDQYVTYMKSKWGITDINLYYKPGERMVFTVDGAQRQVWNYEVYLFPDQRLEIAILTHRMFDDRLLAAPTADKSANRFFMALDWTDIDIVQAWNKSVVRQTNEADDLYKCVIEIPKAKYFLKSQRIAVVVNDPNRHCIYHNFGAYCPTMTATTCSDHQ